MLFTPKKRGRDWYWFNMMFLYVFSACFAVGTVSAVIVSDDDVPARIVMGSAGLLVTAISWALARYFSRTVASMSADDRR